MAPSKSTSFEKKLTRQWAEMSAKALEVEAEDRELRAHWRIYRYATAARTTQILGLPAHPIELVVKQDLAAKGYELDVWGDEDNLLHPVADRLKKGMPDMAHAFAEHLPAWIRHMTYFQLSMTAPDAESKRAFLHQAALAVPLKFDRLPNNPLRIMSDPETGTLTTLENVNSASQKHFMQIESLKRILQPGRPPGRPKTSAREKPAPAGKRSLDPKLAARAYQMHSYKNHWTEIARACYPHAPPAERRSEKMRAHIGRLIARGQLDARRSKKVVRNN